MSMMIMMRRRVVVMVVEIRMGMGMVRMIMINRLQRATMVTIIDISICIKIPG